MNNLHQLPTGNARLRILLGKAAETAGALANMVTDPKRREQLQRRAEKLRQRSAALED